MTVAVTGAAAAVTGAAAAVTVAAAAVTVAVGVAGVPNCDLEDLACSGLMIMYPTGS